MKTALQVHFVALLMEALHNYVLYTYVMNERPLLHRWQMLLITLLGPLLAVGPTVAGLYAFLSTLNHSYSALYNSYTTETTCWLSYGSVVAPIVLAPLAIMTAVSVIVGEATGMRQFPEHHKARNHYDSVKNAILRHKNNYAPAP